METNPIIRHLVGNCHVGMSDTAVIRHIISRLKEGYKTWKGLDKEQRKKFMRQAVYCHRENQGLYHYVTRGSSVRGQS